MIDNLKKIKIANSILVSVGILSAILFVFLLSYKVVVLNTDIGKTIYPEEIIETINEERSAEGLPPLARNTILDAAAMSKAEDMARYGYFSHNTPNGETPWDFMEREGYEFVYAGENLAVDFFDVEEVSEAWMDSPGHRDNIMNVDFSETGIGVAKGLYENREVLFYVQMFGRQAEGSALGLERRPQVLGASTDVDGADSMGKNEVLLDYFSNPTKVLENAYYLLTVIVLLLVFLRVLLSKELRSSVRMALYGFATVGTMWLMFYVYNAISFVV